MLDQETITGTEIPISEICLDADFNCRRNLTTVSCIPLANSIAVEGLLNPITVRRLRDTAKNGLPSEKDLVDKGFKYKVVAGHRRFTACKYLGWDKIPVAKILADTNSDFTSKTVCAIENLHREDLTLYEEALAIKHYYLYDWSIADVAAAIRKSPPWVATRFKLLQLPDVIQNLAHEGTIRATDVDRLYKYRNEQDVLLEQAAKIKSKNQGVKSILDELKAKDPKKPKGTQKKRRDVPEIEKMILFLAKVFKDHQEQTLSTFVFITPEGFSLATSALAWAAGNLTNEEFFLRVEILCDYLNIKFDTSEHIA